MSTFFNWYDAGQYGYMGFGDMPRNAISLTITAPTSSRFLCGGADNWGICAYNPSSKTQYALLKGGSLAPVYHSGNTYFLCSKAGEDIGVVPQSVTVTVPVAGAMWDFHGGLTSVAGCALCIVTYWQGQLVYGDSPCGSDYVSIADANTSLLTYEATTTRYADSIDECPIFADRAECDINGDKIDTKYQKKIVAGPGININNGNTVSWRYSVGRNLIVNPSEELCLSLPGAIDDASQNADNLFYPVTNGDFATAYALMTRQNAYGSYNIGIRYKASGTSATYTFVGTETVIGNDNSVTVNPAVYISEPVVYSGVKFGTTTFDPAIHKAIYYSGLAVIGYLSDTKIAIFKDVNNNVKVAFTSVEAKIW